MMTSGTLFNHFRNLIGLLVTILLIVSCTAKKKSAVSNTTIPSNLGKNDSVPNAPTVTSPAYNPFTTAASQLTISGGCITDNMVSITGSSTQAAKCIGDAYSFVVSGTSDATYTYYLAQKSPSGVVSTKTNFVWTRSQTVVPVGITAPATSPYLSNNQNLTIAGTCTPGYGVNIVGDYSASVNCENAATFSFAVTKTTDGTYNFSITQVDKLANISSAAFNINWTLDTTAPVAPTLVTPILSPHTSTSNSLTVTVGCEDGNTVNVTGDKQASGSCSANSFTFSDNKAAFGTYNYSFTQVDAAGNTSPALAFQWNYVATFVPPVAITGPAYNDLATPKTKFVSNQNALDLAGTCLTGYSVELSGASTQFATCSALGTFTFNISKATDVSDGTYTFLILQRDPNNSTPSASVQYIWNRDITTPGAVALLSPADNPYTGASLSVVVSCDNDNSMTATGVNGSDGFIFNANGTCVGSQFTFVDSIQSNDGTITYSITQADLAQNTSVPFTFQWIRDTQEPPAPTMSFAPVNPATPISPSRADAVVISGSCNINHTVHLSGDVQSSEVTGGLLYQICSVSNTYSFTVDKTNDPDPLLDPNPVKTYNFQVHQVRPSNNVNSAVASGSWSRDKLVLVPTITIPTSGTYVSSGSIEIQGACEVSGNVNLYVNGAFDQSVTCGSGGTYLVNTSTATVGTYTYALSQTDYPGNVSVFTSDYTWIVSAGMPPNPTILLPSSVPNPYVSNDSNLYITGICDTNNTVNISGSANVSLPGELGAGGVQTVNHTCTGGSYTYYLAKPASEGTFAVNIKQSNLGVDSATESRNWVRDATAPLVSIGTSPNGRTLGLVFPSPNPTPTVSVSALGYNPQISFSSSDMTSVTYRCKLDNGSYASCTSPMTYYSSNTAAIAVWPSPSPTPVLSEGTFHSFYVEATDQANNITTQQVNWFQAAYKTIALYHFNNNKNDNSAYALSSLSAGAGSVTFSTGTNAKMGNASSGTYAAYFNGSASLTSTSTNSVLDLGNTSKNTIEAFVKLAALPDSTNTYMVIASKNGGTNEYGWELGIKYRNGSASRIYFKGTIAKASIPTEFCGGDGSSGGASAIANSSLLNIWKHYAVVVSGTAVDLYLDGVKMTLSGTAPCTATGGLTALAINNAPLVIGDVSYSPTGYLKLNGYIDEFRWSRTLRYTTGFAPTTVEFTNVVTNPNE